jgi:predicted nucleic acid-binding protein
MSAAVDTNILLDILLPDPIYKESSLDLLTKYLKTDKLIISEIVYAELASQFTDKKLLRAFLNDVGIKLIHSTPDALWVAAEAWKEYSRTRDKRLQCNYCGGKAIYKCIKCDGIVLGRQNIISDFLIAGHALIEAGKLLTRDRGFFRTYFPELDIEMGAD